jgi:hypothetical protein
MIGNVNNFIQILSISPAKMPTTELMIFSLNAPKTVKKRQSGYRAIAISFNQVEKGDRIMKRKMLVGVLILVVLLGTAWAGPPTNSNAGGKSLGPPANSNAGGKSLDPPANSNAGGNLPSPPSAQIVGGEWVTPADFTTKFWEEKFFGGGPGAEGNVLMAIGQGFVFQNAVLTVAPVQLKEPLPSWCDGVAVYETIYENGRLTLNPSGPWLKKGTLRDRDVKATNISCHGSDGALLGFTLTIKDESFEEFAELPYFVEASFTTDQDDSNYKIFVDEDGITVQKGYNFDATIVIEGTTP